MEGRATGITAYNGRPRWTVYFVALDVNIGDTIISEEKSNKLEDVVFKYARMLEDSYSDELLQEFSNNLKRKIPNYEWLLNAFKNIGWG